jgi:predicted nucleotidyltransferase
MAKIKAELKKKILKFYEAVKTRYTVKKIFVFGSYANGNPRTDSDVDIGVVLDIPFKNKIDINAELWMIAGRIDSKIEPFCIGWSEYKNHAPASILAEIVRQGIDIVEAA